MLSKQLKSNINARIKPPIAAAVSRDALGGACAIVVPGSSRAVRVVGHITCARRSMGNVSVSCCVGNHPAVFAPKS